MMNAATMPDTAAGRTTWRVVVALRAPRPALASRSSRGTAASASSATDATRGNRQDADADRGRSELAASFDGEGILGGTGSGVTGDR